MIPEDQLPQPESLPNCNPLPCSEQLEDNLIRDIKPMHHDHLAQYDTVPNNHLDHFEALSPGQLANSQMLHHYELENNETLHENQLIHDMPLANAIQLSSPSSEKTVVSENENNFIQIILTRLLVRPDVAPLFSELISLFGKSLEDSMLLQAKWFLGVFKPWGLFSPCTDLITTKRNKRKVDSLSLEEGEVAEGVGVKRPLKGFSQVSDSEGSAIKQLHGSERAFLELILPCINQSSDESRYSFASDLIKQLSYIEQQIVVVTRGPGKPAASMLVTESPENKVNARKTIKGGSPGLARRLTFSTDSSPPSPAALRASMSLRIQLIMRLFPILYTNGEPSVRNMRHTLASVILRLLCSRTVFEDANVLVNATHSTLLKGEVESPSEVACAAFGDSSVSNKWEVLTHFGEIQR
ncbi:hypothetical protein KIW84_020559 [Lathyrus oleraceus]|uniref:Uncharacterized protein n=1 Tax=Pisum sativum TaxID=3888 RepID=A0A9D4Y5U7_PEA|nr:hypothetical protein KIW84_020559 [Pisum sativum]